MLSIILGLRKPKMEVAFFSKSFKKLTIFGKRKKQQLEKVGEKREREEKNLLKISV